MNDKECCEFLTDVQDIISSDLSHRDQMLIILDKLNQYTEDDE